MPKIDLSTLELRTGSIYPEPYASEMAGRSSLRLGAAGGLTQFGANLVFLEPGAKSSLRHWHLDPSPLGLGQGLTTCYLPV